ncbi:hypothetical protein DCAR_0522552 [Daucus carota subsp. sativus]|uniref:protein-disulfide reductase n=1 Tax=Daucus carota subsp. sativus TaxID=79200 RepID=A0AAF1B3D5_DAUCS|nr:hypothetical protein DCAR_0522552 [Daucus carota subsp. sativus]
MTFSIARSMKLGRCSKRKKKTLLSPTRKKRRASVQPIKKGDKVDLSTLLFTKQRDYLLRGDKQRVQAKQLAGKVIFVGAPDAALCSAQEVCSTPQEQRFEERYSLMPWLTIPFSDLKTRKHLETRFGGIAGFSDRYPVSFVIDPEGVVLQDNGGFYFQEYGAPGYPFSDEKINIINSEDDAAIQHPSITTLLASPERNYVISNSGDQVLVSDLEDKVVALYFYEELPIGESPDADDLTPKIEMVYRQLAKNENFEIVLIYAHDTVYTYDCTTEASFRKTFSKMPWLALPFKDPNCKRLQRIFDHPLSLKDLGPDPTLVIIGPHGNFIEEYGVDILLNFGIAAYPFTRKSAAKLEAEKAKRVKLEMFWRDPNTFFRQKDGPDVSFYLVIWCKL